MSDDNLHNYYGKDSYNDIVLDEDLGTPALRPKWSDTLKITDGCHSLNVTAPRIYGGAEDCVDINNQARDIVVSSTFVPQGKFAATIKGGVHGVTLIGTLWTRGSEVDIDLGNWSDQSSRKTTRVALNLETADGKPVRVRVLNAEKPIVVGDTRVEYIWPHPDAWYHRIVVLGMLVLGKVGLLKYL